MSSVQTTQKAVDCSDVAENVTKSETIGSTLLFSDQLLLSIKTWQNIAAGRAERQRFCIG